MSNNNSKSFTQEFFGFLKTFGIIGLAIAFVIGLAASRLVTSLVQDIINPTVGLFLPASLEEMSANVTTFSGGTSEFKYGDLIANIIDFVIIALIVFVAYKILKKHKLIDDKTEAESK
ncbi:MAG TPA: MscL family protein [Nitrososphaeraceae archaeon]|jgi:large conductance mechanosensitive channel